MLCMVFDQSSDVFSSVKKWVVCCDQHFGKSEGDHEAFFNFIESHDWKETGLILLGDVFNIWIPRKKFLSACHHSFLKLLSQTKSRSKFPVIFCCGNRDIFITPESSRREKFPFDLVIDEEFVMNFGEKICIHISHGDLINTDDIQYRRLRGLLHSKTLNFLISLLPKTLVCRLMIKLEKLLRGSNMENKKYFPFQQFQMFLNKNNGKQENRMVALVGHFHPEQLIKEQVGNVEGFVLKPWFLGNTYYELNLDGQLTELTHDT